MTHPPSEADGRTQARLRDLIAKWTAEIEAGLIPNPASRSMTDPLHQQVEQVIAGMRQNLYGIPPSSDLVERWADALAAILAAPQEPQRCRACGSLYHQPKDCDVLAALAASQEPAAPIYKDEQHWFGLAPELESIGTVEGYLKGLITHGKDRFLIVDPITGRQVVCYFSGRIEWQDVHRAFGKRVAATGLIKARRSGEKVSISASGMHVFPDDNELPSASDVLGILKARCRACGSLYHQPKDCDVLAALAASS